MGYDDTGGRRQCGRLDLVTMRHSHMVNGYNLLSVNKLDVLDKFDEIKLGVKCVVNEEELSSFPGTNKDRRFAEC